MSGIKLNIGAGYVSAFYFIILDLFLLTLYDVVFSRFVCYAYYRRINSGFPISIHSADIPGVTSNLIGRYYSRANVVVYLLKFFLLGCLLYIDLGIKNTEITTIEMMSRTGTFVFNATDSAWFDGLHRSVQRRWENVRQCRTQDGETAQFYHIAFNLSHGLILDNEVVTNGSAPLHEMNDTTLECLSPDFVTEQYSSPMISVIGCSQLEPTTCLNETIISTQVDLLGIVPHEQKLAKVGEGDDIFNYRVLHYQSTTLFEIFPAYANASNKSEMTCTSTFIGVSDKSSMFLNCLLVVYNESTTIIERWEFNIAKRELVRYFPGPVFNGTIDYGRTLRVNQLRFVKIQQNWLSFSATVVADSMVYQRRDRTFEQYRTQSGATEVSRGTVILAAILLVLGIVARIVTAYTVGQDERPQLNTIDGLSSVAREELQPSGRSYVAGENVSLGWSYKGPSLIRFGPVRSADYCVKRSSKEDIG